MGPKRRRTEKSIVNGPRKNIIQNEDDKDLQENIIDDPKNESLVGAAVQARLSS